MYSLAIIWIIYEFPPKFLWNFAMQDFSRFTQEKHKHVVNLIIIYVVIRQSNIKWLKIFSLYLNL